MFGKGLVKSVSQNVSVYSNQVFQIPFMSLGEVTSGFPVRSGFQSMTFSSLSFFKDALVTTKSLPFLSKTTASHKLHSVT
jgi:hypothetical protein